MLKTGLEDEMWSYLMIYSFEKGLNCWRWCSFWFVYQHNRVCDCEMCLGIPAWDWPQTYALDHVATGISETQFAILKCHNRTNNYSQTITLWFIFPVFTLFFGIAVKSWFSFLGTFVKLQKVTIDLVTSRLSSSVSLSTWSNSAPTWWFFLHNLMFHYFSKICWENWQDSLKSDKCNVYFTRRPIYCTRPCCWDSFFSENIGGDGDDKKLRQILLQNALCLL
jgi:hypothetical protein